MNAIFRITIAIILTLIYFYWCFIAKLLTAHILQIQLYRPFAYIRFLSFIFKQGFRTFIYQIVQCILPVFIFQAFVQRFITDQCIFIRRHFSKLEDSQFTYSQINKVFSVHTNTLFLLQRLPFKSNTVPSEFNKVSDVLVVCTLRIFQYIFSVECTEKI